jgi:hypothetical protein
MRSAVVLPWKALRNDNGTPAFSIIDIWLQIGSDRTNVITDAPDEQYTHSWLLSAGVTPVNTLIVSRIALDVVRERLDGGRGDCLYLDTDPVAVTDALRLGATVMLVATPQRRAEWREPNVRRSWDTIVNEVRAQQNIGSTDEDHLRWSGTGEHSDDPEVSGSS